MILLITPSARGQDCAQALHLATSLRQAVGCLRAQDFSAVVIDQSALDLEPDEGETLLQHIGTAVPVHVSFAVNSMERVVRELRAALQRREKESLIWRKLAEQGLRNELKGTATAILVSCEMALNAPELPVAAQARIQNVHQLARQICGKLGIAE